MALATVNIKTRGITMVCMSSSPERLKLAKALMNIDQAVQLLGGTVGSVLTLLRGGYSNGHLPLIEAFYRSLREGTELPVTGEDGRETVAILDQIWAKMDRNQDT